jgi:hypothetical protein
MRTLEMVVQKPRSTMRTWAAIVFCLVVILPIRLFINRISPQPTVAGDGLREAIILACAAGLLLYVHYVEKLPFTSIGIGTSVWWKSALWGVVTAAICLAAAGGIMYATKLMAARMRMISRSCRCGW